MNYAAHLAALTLALTPALALANPYETINPAATIADEVTTSDDRHERMTVPVTIAGSGPYRFIVDTGAERTVLAQEIATQLALPLGDKALLMGVAGSQTVDTVELNDLAFGQQSYSGLIAPLLSSRNLGADGIIGIDSLQDQRVLFDFDRSIMAIAPGGDQVATGGYDIVVTARRKSGQLILTEATVGGIRVDVVIDTGAQHSIANRALQRSLNRRGMTGEQTLLTSVTGQQINTDVGLLRDVVIGDLRFEQMGAVFADAPPFAALGLDQRPAMLLGMANLRLFKRVLIDFPRRRVFFDFAD